MKPGVTGLTKISQNYDMSREGVRRNLNYYPAYAECRRGPSHRAEVSSGKHLPPRSLVAFAGGSPPSAKPSVRRGAALLPQRFGYRQTCCTFYKPKTPDSMSRAGCAAVAGLLLIRSVFGCRKTPPGRDPVIPELPCVDRQTVLFSENFDAENSGKGSVNWNQLAGWEVAERCVDLLGNGSTHVQRNNGWYVDLDGTCNGAWVLKPKEQFSVTAGGHVLELWLSGNQRITGVDGVVVTLGTVSEERFILAHDEPFRQITRSPSVRAAPQARLPFADESGDDRGILLDEVRIRRGNSGASFQLSVAPPAARLRAGSRRCGTGGRAEILGRFRLVRNVPFECFPKAIGNRV